MPSSTAARLEETKGRVCLHCLKTFRTIDSYAPDQIVPAYCSLRDWQRFTEKIIVSENGCWLWRAYRNKKGYGTFQMRCNSVLAHRFCFTAIYGQIPDKFGVCHTCDTPGCVNPAHLFLGTQKDNMQDCARKKRTSTTVKPERFPRGEKHWNAKLTEEKVRKIRRLQAEGKRGYIIADIVGVHRASVYEVLKKEGWRHVKE